MAEINKAIWETEEGKIEFESKLREIIEKVSDSGQLICVATKQHGKTNAMMWLMQLLRNTQEHKENRVKLIMFDTCLNFRYKFDEIPFVDITEIRHIPLVQDLLIDLLYTDTQLTRDAITQILKEDFIKKSKLKKKFDGINPYLNYYMVEEMQNVWGTYALSGTKGRFALKIFSEAMNFGMVILGVTQRLADVSTKICERSKYLLVGALQGDNDIGKLKRITNKQISEKVKTLKKGEFLFIDRDNLEYAPLIYFPIFKQSGKPYPYKNSQNGEGYVKKIFF